MSAELSYKLIDDIKCYSPDGSEDYTDYPEDGFDVTHKLEQSSFWVSSRNRLLKTIILECLRDNPNPKFLEVGCGTGTFISQFVNQDNVEITGSEIYLRGILYAKKKMPSVEFVQYDARQGIIPKKYDIIGSFDVLEHIDDDTRAMSNIYNMLTNGGYFVLTVPQYMFMWSKVDDIVKHKRRYSRKELIQKLEKQGFEIEYCTSFLFVLFPAMMLSRFLDKGTPDPDSIQDNDFESRVSIPVWLNWIFNHIMKIDEFLIARRISLPFGGTLLAIAKRPEAAITS